MNQNHSIGWMSSIGGSDRKKDAMMIEMKLHVQYTRIFILSGRTGHCCRAAESGRAASSAPGRVLRKSENSN
jgi:hypothetical protein